MNTQRDIEGHQQTYIYKLTSTQLLQIYFRIHTYRDTYTQYSGIFRFPTPPPSFLHPHTQIHVSKHLHQRFTNETYLGCPPTAPSHLK